MRFPELSYSDGIGKTRQREFYGLTHTLGAADGQIYDMRNMTSDHYPVLSVRDRRMLLERLEDATGVWYADGRVTVAGGALYYGGAKRAEGLTGTTVCALGRLLVILPDKKVYDTDRNILYDMEATVACQGAGFSDGTLFGEEAEANTLTCPGMDWSEQFAEGDAVSITGCTAEPGNNKTAIIREIHGEALVFSEYCFTLKEGEAYTEPGELTVSRSVPDLEFVCENENRLWGCAGDTIYACKPGDPTNWNVFDGISTDAWATDTGSPGRFTGCCSYLGYPVFFKEERIYKIYGTVPSAFQVVGGPATGVQAGCAGSLAIAGETLYYKSTRGIMAYTGSVPTCISGALGPEYFGRAVGGSDGDKYYVSMETAEGWGLYVFDTRLSLWHREDDTQALGFAWGGGALYMLASDGGLWQIGRIREKLADAQEEAAVPWWVEFADIVEDEPNRKGISKLQIRLEVEAGASCQVWIRYDSEGAYEQVAQTLTEQGKRSCYLPVIPRRADHYRIKLTGTGTVRIYSIAREFYTGSEL